MSESHGLVWWSELMTRDVTAAQKYYGAACRWEFEKMAMPDGGDYVIAKVGGKPVAGIMDISSMEHLKDVPAHWFTYFAVDDVDAEAAAITAAGGMVLTKPFDIPGTGRIAILQDPTGAAMGMMTPEPM